MVRGMHSSVSSVAYPNISPCGRGVLQLGAPGSARAAGGSPEPHLVAGPDVLLAAVQVDALSDVRGLLLQGHQHVARLVVEA